MSNFYMPIRKNAARRDPSTVNPYDTRSSGGLAALARSEYLNHLRQASQRAWSTARKYSEADEPELYEHARTAQRRYAMAKYNSP